MLVFSSPTSSHRTHGPLPGTLGTRHVPTCPGCSRLGQPLCKVSLPRLWKGFALTYVLMSPGDHLTEFPPTHPNPAQQPGKTGRYAFQACFLSFLSPLNTRRDACSKYALRSALIFSRFVRLFTVLSVSRGQVFDADRISCLSLCAEPTKKPSSGECERTVSTGIPMRTARQQERQGK